METQIQFKCSTEQRELISEAAKIMSIGHSTLARIAVLEMARKILKEVNSQ